MYKMSAMASERITDFYPNNYRQVDFLDSLKADPEPLHLGSRPTRTLSHLFQEDFLPTVQLIRRMYIPNITLSEDANLLKSVEWAQENEELLRSDTNAKEICATGVPFLAGNLQTVTFREVFDDNQEHFFRVGFKPGSRAWELDVRVNTLGVFDRMRRYALVPDQVSTTRHTRALTNYFASGGIYYRQEAVDIITFHLLSAHYHQLCWREATFEKLFK